MKKDKNYYLDLAMAEEEKENYSKALEYAKEAVNINPKDKVALWKAAKLSSCLDLNEEAVEYYNRILAIDSIEIVATFEKIFSLVALKRKAEAYETFDNYVKLNPNDERLEGLDPSFIEQIEKDMGLNK